MQDSVDGINIRGPSRRGAGKATAPMHTDRLAAERIAAVFGAVTLGVLAAAAGADVLAAVLVSLDALTPVAALEWGGYITVCAAAHILLRQAYRRTRPVDGGWRRWATAFTMISLAEGLGWGWGSVRLVTGGNLETELLVLVVTLGVTAGAIPAYSPYLPAFLAFFAPATFPYFLRSATSHDRMEQATVWLMLLFIGGIGGLGVKASQTFGQIVTLRILTEELAEGLRRQKALAEEANRAKSSLLAAASHDLRQPVHALGLFVGALRSIALPAEAERLAKRIEGSIQALDGLFTALLDISQLDAGTAEVRRYVFPIQTLLDRICHDHAADAQAKSLLLVNHTCSAVVYTDPALMERVLRNLVSNAIRYTDRGRVVVGCRRRGDALSVQVWDTGRGIPSDQQERIFQEYYQIWNPERDRTKGLGLGLAIVRRLIDILGCQLDFCSAPGRGSCFAVTLPLSHERVDETTELVGAPHAGALTRGLVVVIDDEIAILDAMYALLTKWGHRVVAAASGDDAMTRLADVPMRPDVIICDYRLRAGENGIEVIERLRSEYNAAIPAMLITGDTAADRLIEAKASGLLLLHKPVANSKLRAAIANLITAPAPDDDALDAIPPVR